MKKILLKVKQLTIYWEDRAQGGQLTENEAVQQFIKLLMENQPDDGRDYSLLLWQMDSMATQLKAAFDELSEVKGQLAQMQESPEKGFISRAMGTVENRLHAVQEGIAGMKERIIEGAKGAVAGVKQTGSAVPLPAFSLCQPL